MPTVAERGITQEAFTQFTSMEKRPHDGAYAPEWNAKNVSTISFVEEQKDTEVTPKSALGEYITRFDSKWQEEGLPQDWYNLRGKKQEVGFSMQKQMSLLEDPTDKDEVALWAAKTKQDLVGFKLEYLSRHVVYPCKYERSSDGTRLESREYGNKDMDETVSDEERGGSVKSALKDMKSFFLSDETPDGSISVMASPKGPSGLKTDRGETINYPDSYFFVMQKNGETVTNYTIKTDFNFHESREAIYQLTGKKLPLTADIEEYVKTIATIKPGDKIQSVVDVAKVLQTVRPSHVFASEADGKVGWNDVYKDILQGEKLYQFNEETQHMIGDFESHVKEGNHTKDDLQKAIAATILRMSKLFLDEKEQQGIPMQMGKEHLPMEEGQRRYGRVLEEVSQRPGCAGGGSGGGTSLIDSIVPRIGKTAGEGDDKYGSREFDCPDCHKKNYRPKNTLLAACQHCESTSVGC